MSPTINLEQRISSRFSRNFLGMARQLAELAAENSWKLYLVGGTVRDLLLDFPSTDVDFLVEGDAVAFSKQLYSAWAGLFPEFPTARKPSSFHRYGTAKISFDAPLFAEVDLLDFASARSEIYPVAGGIPLVSFGEFSSDLKRRDFSANAMAIHIGLAGELVLEDPFSGQLALANKELRVLHAKSFIDDPARLLRGLRFASRFDFHFDPETEKLARAAIDGNALDTMPKPRLFDEFRKALSEKSVLDILSLFEGYGLLEQIHPSLVVNDAELERLQDAAASWKQFLWALIPDSIFGEVLSDFELPTKEVQRLVAERHAS